MDFLGHHKARRSTTQRVAMGRLDRRGNVAAKDVGVDVGSSQDHFAGSGGVSFIS